jgi:hypothetical protein
MEGFLFYDIFIKKLIMGKFILTESEKNEIKSIYKSKGLLFEQGEPQPDLPKVPNWDVASEWVMSKTDKEPLEGIWPETDPEYYYAKYKNDLGNYMEIKSNGLAQEADSNFKLVHNGSWKWNGSEVIFSWLGTKRAGDNWSKAKERLRKNGIDDYKTYIYPDDSYVQSDFTYTDGEWAQGGYNYAKLVDANSLELEIRDNFIWRLFDRASTNVLRAGKWSWNGSKIVFLRGVTKKSSGPLSEEDTDLNTAIMVKNKIGKIGAKGPAVKQIQYQVTPSDSGNQYGTGDGCGNGSSKCTGIYDAKTKELVKTWQKDYGLKADGLWGKESQRYLESATDEKEDESDID